MYAAPGDYWFMHSAVNYVYASDVITLVGCVRVHLRLTF